jgi:hypothetical protein
MVKRRVSDEKPSADVPKGNCSPQALKAKALLFKEYLIS